LATLAFDANLHIVFWIVFLTVISAFITFNIVGFTLLSTLLNNSCSVEKRGGVNGLAQTMIAFAKVLASALGAYFFAWINQSNLIYIISFRMSFIAGSLMFVVCLLLAFKMQKSLNKPFEERSIFEK